MSNRHDRRGLRAATLRGSLLVIAFAVPLALAGAGTAGAQSLGLPPGAGIGGGMPGGVQMPSIASPPGPAPAPAASEPAQNSAPLASSASSCQSDIGSLAQKRVKSIEELNKIAKANKGKLDPIAACPKFRSLIAVEKEFEAYIVKNKDWCNIPDEVLANVKAGTAKDAAVGQKACALAAQVRRAQKQQQAGGLGQAAPPRLPHGPL